MAKSKATPATAASALKARVLVEGLNGKVDDVVVFDSQEELDAAVASGEVDAAPEAVAYAESLVVAPAEE